MESWNRTHISFVFSRQHENIVHRGYFLILLINNNAFHYCYFVFILLRKQSEVMVTGLFRQVNFSVCEWNKSG